MKKTTTKRVPLGTGDERQRCAVKNCKHYWQYVHAVYDAASGLLVRRFCSHCNATQVGKVKRWRPERKKKFGKTAQEAAKGKRKRGGK